MPYDVDPVAGDKSEMGGVYVEEIPANAIRVEGMVTQSGDIGIIKCYLPASLIGKRVQVIVIPEDV